MKPADEKYTTICSGLKCNNCNEIIVSLHRHDFRTCGCGNIAIDGGRDYTKISFNPNSDYENVKVRLSTDCLPETPPSF